ncbi:MAG: fumarylacetoacetate hydrolase family protein [Limisphaerales bacterium]
MRLYTFELNQRKKVGAEWQGQLVDLAAAHSASQGQPLPFPTDLHQFIRMGELALPAAREALDFVKKRRAAPVGEQLLFPLDAVRLLAPIPLPRKILCAGNNFHGHQQKKSSATVPAELFFFAKLPNTVIGPGAPIIIPRLTHQLDYGIALAAIIGRRMKNIATAEVLSAIFGYTILNDLTARDVQSNNNQLTLAKNFDTFCPLGPCIVTPDELPDPNNLQLRTYLNGQLQQSSATADWILSLPRLLSYLSQFMTLEPGDIVSTGTPRALQNPPRFLNPGDTLALEIDNIGRLENPVIAEAIATPPMS